MNDASETGTKRLGVFAIPESKHGERHYWTRIGAAFTNRDGSLTLVLDALPLGTNRLQVREVRTVAEARAGNGSAQVGLETLEVRP